MHEKTHIRFNGIAAICDSSKTGVSFETFFNVSLQARCELCEKRLRQHGYNILQLERRYKEANKWLAI